MFIKLFVARIKDVFAAADIPSPVRKPTQLPGAPPPGLRPAAQICSVYHPRWSETRRGHNSLCIIPVGRRPDGGTTAFASSPLVGDQTGGTTAFPSSPWVGDQTGAQQPSSPLVEDQTGAQQPSHHPRWSKTRRGHNSLRIIPRWSETRRGQDFYPVTKFMDLGKMDSIKQSLFQANASSAALL